MNTKKYGNWELDFSYVLTSEKDLGLQRCDAVSCGERVPTFRPIVVSTFWNVKHSKSRIVAYSFLYESDAKLVLDYEEIEVLIWKSNMRQ